MTIGTGDGGLQARLAASLGDAYTIEGEIGRGGMGVVYKARDERLKRSVAIKVLPPELAYRADIRALFMREAETAARISHPTVVPIHSVGEADDFVYFVMGYVDGESLALRLKRRGRLSIEESRRICRETADALAAAHQQGVIHRDVKPDNILLEGTRGRVMVTDFGIAKALTASGGTLTEAGIAIGTPAFMSPEQAAGEREIDGRSDIYSLGVVTYQMVTGELPFQAPTVPGLLMKQISEEPTPVDQMRPDIPRELGQTVMRCLEKDPERRWPTADALRRALESGTYTPPPPRAPTRASDAARPATGRATPPRDDTGYGRPPARTGRAVGGPVIGTDALGGRAARRAERAALRASRHGIDKKRAEEEEIAAQAKASGEPLMVVRFRRKLASYATVNGMLILINLAQGFHSPWSLSVAAIWGFFVARDYARLWSAGYSWKDVIYRPPAPDAIESKERGAAALLRGSPQDFGKRAGAIDQARKDRAAILAMLERMSKTERKMLPDVVPTVDQLLDRAVDLARTLSILDRDIDVETADKLEARIAALQREPDSTDRERRISLLERQHQTIGELSKRREVLASQFESCMLAMQNVRFDLLRLRSAGVSEALGDLTMATQQARALSLDVDAAIGAASEIRHLTRDTPPTPT
jgi:tRNA A-37 threonylcarbamoyl transferase component Bud32